MGKGLIVFHTITALFFGYINHMLFTEFAGEQWVHWGHYVFWVGVLAMSVGALIASTIAVIRKNGEDMDEEY